MARRLLVACSAVLAACGAATALDRAAPPGDGGPADASLGPPVRDAGYDQAAPVPTPTPPTRLALGEGCSNDSACASGFCLPAADLTGLELGAPGVCSRTCCSNRDCGATGTCYPTAGGSFCVASAPSCGDACVACCKDVDCPGDGGAICANVAARGGVDFVSCAATRPDGSTDECVHNSDCASGVCISNRCDYTASPCCRPTDCPSGLTCQWAELDDESGAVHVFRGCLGGLGSGTPGSRCALPRDCNGGVCATFAGESSPSCTEPCCEDADCATAGAGWVCRPYSADTARVGPLPFPVLVCQPPAR